MGLDKKLEIYLQSSLSKKKKISRSKSPQIGYIRRTPRGEVWVVDWLFDEGHRHGSFELQKIENIHHLLDFSLPQFNPTLATVVDTETTGLAGGTGTYAFIIGAGFWRNDQFIIRQYVMRDFNEEAAQLKAFAEDCTQSLITYNGKCFDLPLLTSRFHLHRFELPFAESPHLDMLFPCRRIWKRHLPEFKLSAIEKGVIGFARTDDIPSYLIPMIFFDYLQNRDETTLYPILYHNRDDILSLYLATQIASQLAGNLIEVGSNDDDLLLSLAEIYFGARQYGQAIELLRKINQDFASPETKASTARLGAISFKRLGRWDEALKAFDSMYRISSEAYSLIESAKLYEHKQKDLVQALKLVRQAEAMLEFEINRGEPVAKLLADLAHRKGRLIKKMART
jgi:uncharacterized protein YprB with RNaseH-like and TPR domain